MIINKLKNNRYHCCYYSAMVSIFGFAFCLLNRVPVEGKTVDVGLYEWIAGLYFDEFERGDGSDGVLLSTVDLGNTTGCYFGENVVDNKETFAVDKCPCLIAMVVGLV